MARDKIIDEYRYLGVRSRLVPIDSLEINLSSGSGYGYSNIYRTKRDFVAKNRKELTDFVDKRGYVGSKQLWKITGKEEYLPLEKIAEDNARTFIIPPFPTLVLGMSVVQHFNKMMYPLYERVRSKVGVTFQNGGFNAVMTPLDKYAIKGASDVKKLDKYHSWELRKFVKDIRYALHEVRNQDTGEWHLYSEIKNVKKKIPPETYEDMEGQHTEFVSRLDWYYEDAVFSFVIAPWGEVFTLFDYMNSGDPATTTDNTESHNLVSTAFVMYHYGQMTYRMSCNLFYTSLYSDDNNFGTDLALLARFETRNKFYQACGWNLKPEDDQVQATVQGLKFLGGICKKHRGVYVPVFDAGRIMSSVMFDKKRLSARERYNKCVSLLILSTFSGKRVFNVIHDFIEHMMRRLDVDEPDWYATPVSNDPNSIMDLPADVPLVPSRDWCIRFWTGFE